MREIALNRFFKTIGYTFKNVALFEQAMTHRSVEGRPNNERLEFLGDSVLGFIIAEDLFKRFPGCAEGELTRLRSNLVKGVTLAKMALEMGLSEMMNLGLGELNTGGFRRKSTLEDAFEAMLGAILLDSDLPTVQALVIKWFEPLMIPMNAGEVPRDYKSQLQETVQAKGLSVPHYEILREVGPDHDKIFFVKCTVAALNLSAEGQGMNRKTAEQEAAQKLLKSIADPLFKTGI